MASLHLSPSLHHCSASRAAHGACCCAMYHLVAALSIGPAATIAGGASGGARNRIAISAVSAAPPSPAARFGFHGVPFHVPRKSTSQRPDSSRQRTVLVLYTALSDIISISSLRSLIPMNAASCNLGSGFARRGTSKSQSAWNELVLRILPVVGRCGFASVKSQAVRPSQRRWCLDINFAGSSMKKKRQHPGAESPSDFSLPSRTLFNTLTYCYISRTVTSMVPIDGCSSTMLSSITSSTVGIAARTACLRARAGGS